MVEKRVCFLRFLALGLGLGLGGGLGQHGLSHWNRPSQGPTPQERDVPNDGKVVVESIKLQALTRDATVVARLRNTTTQRVHLSKLNLVFKQGEAVLYRCPVHAFETIAAGQTISETYQCRNVARSALPQEASFDIEFVAIRQAGS